MLQNLQSFRGLVWPGSKSCRALVLILALGFLATLIVGAEDLPLPKSRYRSGDDTLNAFAPVSAITRQSIIRLNVNGETVALGVIMNTNGLALTKASEIKKGKLTCWLSTEMQVDAEVLAVDEDEDLALVRVKTKGLKPIEWDSDDLTIGQWAITPGIIETPHAVGIISALPRKIRPERALVGIRWDINTTTPRIEGIVPGFGAEKAGLQRGDIIMAVNDAAVTNRDEVSEIIRDYREGQTVNLKIQRDSEELAFDIRLMSSKLDPSVRETYQRQPSRRLTGQVSQRAEGFRQAIEHDTVLQPWLCGGPLVNLDGKAIGLNIARAGRVSTYALPAKLVKKVYEDLSAQIEHTTIP